MAMHSAITFEIMFCHCKYLQQAVLCDAYTSILYLFKTDDAYTV